MVETGQARLLKTLHRLLGDGGLLTDEAARIVYARDASHLTLGRPLAVALPVTVQQVGQIIAACRDVGVPLVPRGGGSGLSGGAVPPDGSVVLGCARLQATGPVHAEGRCVQVQVGVPNDKVSRLAAAAGLHFAPDPSSQSVATVGGNIAENAGGPHCLRHGVTRHHVRSLQWLDANGRVHGTGAGAEGERGLDLASLLCGSEGTLGVVIAADLGLVAIPAAESTLLAFFPDLAAATGSVVSLLGAGMLPVAVEMIDQAMLLAVERAFGFGFRTDAAAAMIVEFHGTAAEVGEDADRAETLLRRSGAHEIRRAVDPRQRAELWKCRKKAFGAVGRLAPSYVSMDVVVPLASLPALVQEIQVIKSRHEVGIATAFHAGDGNLHPGVHYDDRDPQARRRAHTAADEIIAASLAHGGSVTGEHGVGLEKLHVLPWQMDAVTARLHHGIKNICDPAGILNPGKLLPAPTANYAALPPVPTALLTRADCLTVTAPADTRLSEVQAAALDRGLWLPVGLPPLGASSAAPDGGPGLGHDPLLGELLDHLSPGPALFAAGTVRNYLLESWCETGDGELFHSGAPVFKNVAGYSLHQMLCGSGGNYVRHLAATFQLRPCPEHALLLELAPSGAAAGSLAPLWQWLGTRRGTTAGDCLVLEPERAAYLLVAGRDRPWDLGAVPGQVEALVQPHGWAVVGHCRASFAQACGWLTDGGLPAWSLGHPDWTSVAPRPGQVVPQWPWPGCRLIRQADSGRLWVPGQVDAVPGWHVDAVMADSRPTPTPEPDPQVPRHLLAGLKSLLDPAGALGAPPWLVAAGGRHD